MPPVRLVSAPHSPKRPLDTLPSRAHTIPLALAALLGLAALAHVGCGGDDNAKAGGAWDVNASGPRPDVGLGPVVSPDASPPATCDDLEPNNTVSRAVDLRTLDAPLEARVCSGDVDWFAFELVGAEVVTLELAFQHSQGDLDMTLFDAALGEVARAESVDDDESLEVALEGPGTWLLQIYGYEGSATDYTLTWELGADPGQACDDDAQEPNDTLEAASAVEAEAPAEGTICAGDVDVFTLPGPVEGESVVVELAFEHAGGDLDLELLDADSARVALSASADDDERVVWTLPDGAPPAPTLYARVYGHRGATNAYALTARLTDMPDPPDTHVATGQVRFEDPVLDLGRGVYNAIWAVASDLHVELRDVDDNALLGEAYTDPDGTYTLTYTPSETTTAAYLRVLASLDLGGNEAQVVTLSRELYAVRTAETLDPRLANPGRLDIDIPSMDNIAAPFNVTQAIRRGMAWWGDTLGLNMPAPRLHIVWEDQRQLACGTCYRHSDTPNTIYLLGLVEDNDALDDPVILHELGHFIQNIYSWDDSPGGFHDGTPTDPRLAWAEGWATFFACMVRDAPIYYDLIGDWYTLHDLETPDPILATFDGDDVNGDVSEYLVAGMLWDMYDLDALDQDQDAAMFGIGALNPVLDYLRSGQRAVRGVSGVDLVDYLDGAHCAFPDDHEAIGTLLTPAAFPYTPPEGCKPGVPLRAELHHDATTKRVTGITARAARPVQQLTVHACTPTQCSPPLTPAPSAPVADTVTVTALPRQHAGAPVTRFELRARTEASVWTHTVPHPDAPRHAKPPRWDAPLGPPTSAGQPTRQITVPPSRSSP